MRFPSGFGTKRAILATNSLAWHQPSCGNIVAKLIPFCTRTHIPNKSALPYRLVPTFTIISRLYLKRFQHYGRNTASKTNQQAAKLVGFRLLYCRRIVTTSTRIRDVSGDNGGAHHAGQFIAEEGRMLALTHQTFCVHLPTR